jgi:hypothetical protein
MLKKVVLTYSAINSDDNKKIDGKRLGEIEMHTDVLNNGSFLRAYAYLYFPEELSGKENVEINVSAGKAMI